MPKNNESKGKAREINAEEEFEANQWPPGQSGNPNGLKPGTKHGPRAQLNRLLKHDASPELLKKFAKKFGNMECKTNGDLMAQVHFALILKGDMAAIREAYAQVELPHPKDLNLAGDFNITIPAKEAKAFLYDHE